MFLCLCSELYAERSFHVYDTQQALLTSVTDCGTRKKCTGWAKKNGLFLRSDNFATTNDRKACNMSKVSEFCLELTHNLHVTAIKHFLPYLHKSLVPENCVQFDNDG